MAASITLAVVSWNTREPLDRCLASLRGDAEAGLAEVWIVDNGSGDGSAELVRERHRFARLLEPGENLGYGRAVNLVAERTDTPWIVAANADVELPPGTLVALLAAAERHPEAGVIAPKLVDAGGAPEHSIHPFQTPAVAALYNLGLHRLAPRAAARLPLPGHFDPEAPRAVDWAHGAFLLIRREAFEAAGGFDPGQWIYAEDVELGYRMRDAGWEVHYAPTVEVRHLGGAATATAFGASTAARRLDATYALLRRREGRAATALVYALNALGSAVRWLTLAPRRDPATRARRRALAQLVRYHLRR